MIFFFVGGVLWTWSVFLRLMDLNTWTPSSLKDYRTQRKWTVAGKSCLFTGGSEREVFNPASLPVHTLIMTTHETCLLFLQYPSYHDGWWTANQNTPFFPWVLPYQVFDFSSRNVTNTLGNVSVFECSLWSLGMGSQKHGPLKPKCYCSGKGLLSYEDLGQLPKLGRLLPTAHMKEDSKACRGQS